MLLNEPKTGVKAVKEAFEAAPGKYMDSNDDVYEVVKSGQGRYYAKRLVLVDTGKTCGGCENCDGEDACKIRKGQWQYAAGAIKNFQSWVVLDLTASQNFGHKFGVCCCCGRTLTNPDSIAAGIGPICAEKF